ncbi:LOW QUALITY PROTEIN: hypothetical protein KUTeg_018201, partial [Tegillarca granosa]
MCILYLDYTLEQEGSKQVQIIGFEDKRQITVLLGVTMSGNFIPPQIIYAGETDMCHPKSKFPDLWNVTHTAYHWSNSESMLQYLYKVLIPYIESIREDLPLDKADQPALCIFDVFRAHQVEEFKENYTNITSVCVMFPQTVPVNYSPSISRAMMNLKHMLKNAFIHWYAEQIQAGLKSGKCVDNINVDLKLSTLKPLHDR